MSDCWVCKQKAEWKQEKISKVREEAKQRSAATGKTVAIVQKGCLYEMIENFEGLKVKEYISANSS